VYYENIFEFLSPVNSKRPQASS